MMRPNRVRQLHRDGQAAISAWLSIPSFFHAEVACHTGVDAVERIRAAVTRRGLLPGIFCSGGEAARARIAQGFALVTPGNDAAVFRAAYTAQVKAARA